MSSICAVPLLQSADLCSQIPIYASFWVVRDNWAPVRLKRGSIDRSGSSRLSFVVPSFARSDALWELGLSEFLGDRWKLVGAPLLLSFAANAQNRFLYSVSMNPIVSQFFRFFRVPSTRKQDVVWMVTSLKGGSSDRAHRAATRTPWCLELVSGWDRRLVLRGSLWLYQMPLPVRGSSST